MLRTTVLCSSSMLRAKLLPNDLLRRSSLLQATQALVPQALQEAQPLPQQLLRQLLRANLLCSRAKLLLPRANLLCSSSNLLCSFSLRLQLI